MAHAPLFLDAKGDGAPLQVQRLQQRLVALAQQDTSAGAGQGKFIQAE